jgi:tetratricopeptide (TPR) repeat protein
VSLHAAEPWHLSGWLARASVEVTQPSAETGVDTAAVKILCQGLAKPDGSDYRVVDAAGQAVPFQLTYHDAGRYSWVAFKAANPKQKYFVYFGNPKAERSPEQVVADAAPGKGPPQGSWVPKYGLLYQTILRPRADDPKKETNPRTVDDLTKLLADSKGKCGARYQRRISDGYNPFGSSDYYISVYRGWINIPAAGPYQFCTASNEASFSFLDGKELIHWPGRHTAERGMRGEVNALVVLTAGLHYIEYYHEEVTLDQMAFLGWRPSGDKGQFSAIPESIFTAPHVASVTRYEDPKGALAAFEPEVLDSVWPTDRHEGQYTRLRFQAAKESSLPDGTTVRWEFGDGISATGTSVDHVYLALGSYQVTMSAQTPQGTATARWPLDVYEIENVTEQFKEGKPKAYAQAARSYERARLDARNLKELAYLLAETEDPTEAIAVGNEFVKRFPSEKPETVARVRRLMADCSLRLGKEGIDQAIANYQASLVKEIEPAERLDVLARLIRLLGIERKVPDKAAEIFRMVEDYWPKVKRDEEVTAAYRRAVIAAGDVDLWLGKLDGARALYKRAETLSGHYIPVQVRAARIGAYPNSIREFVESGNYGAALDIVDRWDETFPTEKPNGHTLFYRGKLLALRGQSQDAARHLARAIALTSGAQFETEARWLLAESLEQMGKKDEAKVELARLVKYGNSGFRDEFTKKAQDKLQKGLSDQPKK